MLSHRGELLLALLLWPYGAWMTLYFLRHSVAVRRSKDNGPEPSAPKWVLWAPVIPILLFIFGSIDAFRASAVEGTLWLLAGFGVGLATRWWGSRARGEVLDRWARTVALSYAERNALAVLWKAFRESETPALDPLAGLNARDRAHLLEVSGLDFRPLLFGRNRAVYEARVRALTDRGFSEDQARVVCGMIFSKIGRTGKS